MAERLTKPVRLWQLVDDADVEVPAVSGDGVVQDPCDVAFLGPYSFVVADSEGHRLLLVDIARNVTSVIAERQVNTVSEISRFVYTFLDVQNDDSYKREFCGITFLVASS